MANIQLDDSLIDALVAQANARGLSLDAYLHQLAGAAPANGSNALTVAEVDRLLDDASIPGPSAGTYSRAEIYREHD